jgi:hypothetical protein
MNVEKIIFWNMMMYSLLQDCRLYGGTHCHNFRIIHLDGGNTFAQNFLYFYTTWRKFPEYCVPRCVFSCMKQRKLVQTLNPVTCIREGFGSISRDTDCSHRGLLQFFRPMLRLDLTTKPRNFPLYYSLLFYIRHFEVWATDNPLSKW